MSETHRITINSHRCGGRPCLRKLGGPVRDVLHPLAASAGRDGIHGDYPLLEDGDITGGDSLIEVI